MARYLERVENLARLIDVTQTFEKPGPRGRGLERAAAHQRRRGAVPEAGGTLGRTGERQAVLPAGPPDNPNSSIPASLEAARTNARTLRPLISTEMWMQLNVFHRDVHGDPAVRS